YGAGDRSRNRDMMVGALATIYGIWLVYAAGFSYLLMCMVLFAPGIVVYVWARRERGVRAFTSVEALIAAAIVALALVAGWLMWTGSISPL
ncbi:MAG TPA: arginine-ornithine antiporter, partial [Verrucomicrobiae bacterium]|nr:arginine-ornithine antiporter [Verrucomicrobiae bacterium]